MRVAGTVELAAPRERVFAAICDPATLLAVVPGCEAVERVADDRYEGRIVLRLPGFAGTCRTEVRLVDPVPPEGAGLDGAVEGAIGTIRGHADFRLADDGGHTSMRYDGTAVIQGPLARLDSRFAERLAEGLITKGLRALDARLATEGSE